ncbi:MAG TPA: adenylate kinase [Candidatus Moranbacteria bacterium]|nr:MAG: Adenylate kinase [Candidatus Moranbacteria bacterium GW2011_GWC2_45_10]KKT95325.1 MAG: Adenylate kinase [Parcubacteria group bacterium GW2011_GWC1_45_14]HAV11016.1 adenylate kinase [Candidatus Moranbacteria bacterium]
MELKNFLIFGPQGSGKGTQADILAEKFNLVHIETGQIFRDMALADSELGRKIWDLNEKKEMVPDDITLEVLRFHLEKVSVEKGVIIDSAPRTPGQVAGVEKMLKEIGRDIDSAIYITLPYEESVERITKRFACQSCKKHFVLGKSILSQDDPCQECGGKIIQRTDDTPEGIRKRLDTFYEITVPVIEYYREKGILIEVDGRGSVSQVSDEITKRLNG